ncbi:reverse transcriptase domain-containing protein [Tanacetum coccineum]
MENVQDMSGCSVDQKVKYTAGSFVGKALTWWNSQIRTLSQEVVVSMSWNNFKFMMIEKFYHSHEMQKLGIELWNQAIVEAGHAAYTDRFHELARLVPHLVTPKSRKIKSATDERLLGNGSTKKESEYGMFGPWVPTATSYYAPGGPCRTCFNCNRPGQEENRPNQVAANKWGHDHGNQGNQARGRAFMLGAEEARQDPNIMTGIEPSELGFRYEIEIASG